MKPSWKTYAIFPVAWLVVSFVGCLFGAVHDGAGSILPNFLRYGIGVGILVAIVSVFISRTSEKQMAKYSNEWESAGESQALYLVIHELVANSQDQNEAIKIAVDALKTEMEAEECRLPPAAKPKEWISGLNKVRRFLEKDLTRLAEERARASDEFEKMMKGVNRPA